MRKKVNIIEVGPRDGFQSVKKFIPTEIKLEVINGLVQSGVKKIQATSFVSPKAIPQMQDAKTIVQTCLQKYPHISFFALVPNLYGAKVAVESGLDEISYVISVSESHNQANVKRTCDESFGELKMIREQFPDLRINLDAATAFGCPFEGDPSLKRLKSYIRRGIDLGIRSFNIADTIGVAYPTMVREYISALISEYPQAEFHVHIHDTRNMGIINSYTAIECGVKGIEVSLGGLGGCPFAPGASGNTATEDFVYMLGKMGYDTGIDFKRLLITAKHLKSCVDGNYSGHHIFINEDSFKCQHS